MAILAVDQLALVMGEVKERGVVPLHIIQRQDIDVDIGDFPVAERHLVAQVAFGLNPIIGGCFAHNHQQVVSHRVAEARTADKLPEQQDVFGVENTAGQVSYDLLNFGRVV